MDMDHIKYKYINYKNKYLNNTISEDLQKSYNHNILKKMKLQILYNVIL
jgi:hypothetical protein